MSITTEDELRRFTFFVSVIRHTRSPEHSLWDGYPDMVRKPALLFQLLIYKKVELLCKLTKDRGVFSCMGILACCFFVNMKLEPCKIGTCGVTGEVNVRVIPFNFNNGFVVINARCGDACDFLFRIYCFAHFNHRVLANEDDVSVLKDEFLLSEELVDSIISYLS